MSHSAWKYIAMGAIRIILIVSAWIVALFGLFSFFVGVLDGGPWGALGGLLFFIGSAIPLLWFLIKGRQERQTRRLSSSSATPMKRLVRWGQVLGASVVTALVGLVILAQGLPEPEPTVEASKLMTSPTSTPSSSRASETAESAVTAAEPEDEKESPSASDEPTPEEMSNEASDEANDQVEQKQVERDRKAAEKAKQAEQDRRAAAQKAADAERDRKAAEKAKQAEQDRRAAAQKAADAERDRKAAEKAKQAERDRKAAAEKAAAEKAAQEERDRIAAARTSYKNCTDVWQRIGRPITRGEPGYSSKLDRDGDGVGCERDPR